MGYRWDNLRFYEVGYRLRDFPECDLSATLFAALFATLDQTGV